MLTTAKCIYCGKPGRTTALVPMKTNGTRTMHLIWVPDVAGTFVRKRVHTGDCRDFFFQLVPGAFQAHVKGWLANVEATARRAS
jgi:hypothetical protein